MRVVLVAGNRPVVVMLFTVYMSSSYTVSVNTPYIWNYELRYRSVRRVRGRCLYLAKYLCGYIQLRI